MMCRRSARCALMVCRPLLEPNQAAFTVTEAFIVETGKRGGRADVDQLLANAAKVPAQLELWDPE